MALLIINGKDNTISEGEEIKDICEDNDIAFSCQDGVCGTCEITVISGDENLNKPTEEEVEFDMESGKRLACQCIIQGGTVSISD